MKYFFHTCLLLFAGNFLTCASLNAATKAVAQTVPAAQADAFVDSVGVNVHMGDLGSVYSNFANLENALLALGVRHLRDGLISTSGSYYTNHNTLGALGIKTTFITSIGQAPQLWQSYPSLMNQCFEGYENPNEMDDGQGSNWLSELLAQMPALSDAVRGDPNSFPVYGPALVYSQSFSEVGNASRYFDYGNLHNYPGGRNPESAGWGADDPEGNSYGSMPWQLDLLAIDSPGLPWVTTETGYTNETSLSYYVPQMVAATYLPRLVLSNWAWGAHRTYLYELVSDLGGDYGLIDAAWKPKPDFYALASLLNLLSDPGPAFIPGSLTYSVSGGDSNLHHVLLQKRDGSFYLALWIGLSSYNVNTRVTNSVASEFLDIQLPAGMQVTRYQWNSAGQVATTAPVTSSPYKIGINDHLTILRISSAD